MKIRIRDIAYIYADKTEFRDYLKKNVGRWLTVETDHLFNNQYNTAKYRIFDNMIDAVKNDARINMGKCKYCGNMLKAGQVCDKYTDENPSKIGDYPVTTCAQYGIAWFTPENTFFLKYPEGLPKVKKEVLSIHPGCPKFGTYYLESYKSIDRYRLYNARKHIDFKHDKESFYAVGIGWDKTQRLDVPFDVEKDIRKYLGMNII